MLKQFITSLKNLTYLLIFLTSIANAEDCKLTAEATTPTSQFTDNNDGTVTDNKTGLMWQKCSDGQTGNNCEDGEPESHHWDTAISKAKEINSTGGFASYKDWRLPTLRELISITEVQCHPKINPEVFPNVKTENDCCVNPYQSNGDVWTSTVKIDNKTHAFYYNFLSGGAGTYPTTTKKWNESKGIAHARFVRGKGNTTQMPEEHCSSLESSASLCYPFGFGISY